MSIINVNTIQPIGAGQTVTVNASELTLGGKINGYNLPSSGDASGAILGTDGSGNLSWVNGRMVLETAKASTSGTSIDFTGIPSWVKRVTVMFNGVSTNGTSALLIQLGDAGGVETTGYNSTVVGTDTTLLGTASSTAGMIISTQTASDTKSGLIHLCALGSNSWICSLTMKLSTTQTSYGAGNKTLSDTLDRIRITTVNGTDTFDAGTINLLLEG